jgi:hypothetical protein
MSDLNTINPTSDGQQETEKYDLYRMYFIYGQDITEDSCRASHHLPKQISSFGAHLWEDLMIVGILSSWNFVFQKSILSISVSVQFQF